MNIQTYECQCEYKNYHKYKNDYSWNLCENGKYLKSIAGDSKIVLNEVMIYVIDIVSTNETSIYHQMLRLLC